MLGSRTADIAYPLLILSMGGGAVWAGAVASCGLLVQLAFQLPSGHLADRSDPRRLMLGMDVVRLVAVGSIPFAALLDRLTLLHLLVVCSIEGAASAVFGSAAMVFIRVAVSPKQFSRAMSQSQTTHGITMLLGPMAGGALFAVDRFLPAIADTASYVLSGVLLLAISARTYRFVDADPERPGSEQTDPRVTAGLRWLWRSKDVLRIVLFCGVLNMVGVAFGLAAVVSMGERGTTSNVIGIVAACGGSGLIVGSLVTKWVMLLGPVRLYPIAGLLWAGSFAVIAMWPSPWVIAVVLTFLAAVGPSTGVMLFQILADKSPKSLYGRVNAAQTLLGSSLATAGPLLAGVLLATFGGTSLWLTLAGVCLAATAFTISPLFSRPPVDEAPLDPTVALAERNS